MLRCDYRFWLVEPANQIHKIIQKLKQKVVRTYLLSLFLRSFLGENWSRWFSYYYYPHKTCTPANLHLQHLGKLFPCNHFCPAYHDHSSSPNHVSVHMLFPEDGASRLSCWVPERFWFSSWCTTEGVSRRVSRRRVEKLFIRSSPIMIACVSRAWKNKENILLKIKKRFSLSKNVLVGEEVLFGEEYKSFFTWKLKFINVHLMNFESKSKVYYIKRDMFYEKRTIYRIKREERERGFFGVCYYLVSTDILKHCLMEFDVDLVWWRWSWRFVWWRLAIVGSSCELCVCLGDQAFWCVRCGVVTKLCVGVTCLLVSLMCLWCWHTWWRTFRGDGRLKPRFRGNLAHTVSLKRSVKIVVVEDSEFWCSRMVIYACVLDS